MCPQLYHTSALAERSLRQAYARELAEAAIRAGLSRAWQDAAQAGDPILEVRLDIDTWQILTVIERPSRVPRTGRLNTARRLSESDGVGRSDDTKTP